ncbi:hypothetical protein SIID45300_01771 [Candidatus Magnetaquicoccaceae bacterium FCR-1]|uniref:Uncharacterized protein n=1 Tax=Candidatus Magnetaquiglobus chichijimensis TaxID=3141448 RepID=A0ABQ0C985_9PROT
MSCAIFINSREELKVRQNRRRARGHHQQPTLRCDAILLLTVQHRFRRFDRGCPVTQKALKAAKQEILRILVARPGHRIVEGELRTMMHHTPRQVVTEALKSLSRLGRIIHGGTLRINGQLHPCSVVLVNPIRSTDGILEKDHV